MPSELHTLRTLHLFAGAGGGILGDILLGHQCICAVEIEPYCQQVLSARQEDGILPWFPIFDDVTTFDGKPWRGIADVVCGGFPCQDISAAGKGKGIDGERSGMWKEMARIIGEVRPRFVLVENSPVLTSRGLGTVLGDLAALGYDAEWGVLGAVHAGAPHQRERIWIVASNAPEVRREDDDISGSKFPAGSFDSMFNGVVRSLTRHATDTGKPRDTDAVADWMDRFACTGNGQVPAVVRLAWNTLYERIQKH